jgi:hypothetical protein
MSADIYAKIVRRPRGYGWLASRRWFFVGGKCVAFWRST